MKIPKYIDKLIERRVKLAESLNSADYLLSEFIVKNKIDVAEYDYATGIEMYANPCASAERIREAIRNK